ncbi:hypothetical protein C7S16_4464 [Burkholderia thailandensis]|uniref:Uncharacterized protein n=1 Tax=Burkholderia thailandensis TaxID=57975 RepID=A0AAW9CTV5_BURTH|nr:hypothetical protein [Burkholderia thailandensis]MDW9252257.1 hypothetical protein [Burkholderia thailandensis]
MTRTGAPGLARRAPKRGARREPRRLVSTAATRGGNARGRRFSF